MNEVEKAQRIKDLGSIQAYVWSIRPKGPKPKAPDFDPQVRMMQELRRANTMQARRKQQ